MGKIEPEAEALDLPANRHVLATLARSAQPARSEYRLRAFEQLTHPDVCERLAQVAEGGQPVVAYGRCARAAPDGTLYAIGLGTGVIALRLPEGAARGAVLANGGKLDPDLGSDWVLADAWLSEVLRADGTALLASWIEVARLASNA